MATISEEDRKYLTAAEIAALEEMEDDDDEGIDDELDLNELDDEDVLNEEDDDAEDDGYPPAEDDDKKKPDDDQDAEDDDADADDVDNPDAESDADNADADGKKPDAEDADDDGAESDADDEPEPVRTPLLTSKLPPDWKDRLTQIDTDRDKLETRFDDGEVDGKEYRTELRRLEAEQRKIELAVHEAQIAQEMEQAQSKQTWIDTVTDFLDDNKIYKENSSLHDALDSKVKRIAKDPENQNLTGRQILKKAHAQVIGDFPSLFPTKKESDDTTDKGDNKETGKETDTNKDTKERKKAKVRDVPKNLAKMPAAENTPTDPGSKFAALDSLKGVELEKALGRLSEAELEEYMKT